MNKAQVKVAAVSYKAGMAAPTVVAKGQGKVAENILEEASKHDIPVYKDRQLATLLTEIELGEQIPEELYDLVAQILVFVSDVDELYEKTGRASK